jgi:hypothetical protein
MKLGGGLRIDLISLVQPLIPTILKSMEDSFDINVQPILFPAINGWGATHSKNIEVRMDLIRKFM